MCRNCELPRIGEGGKDRRVESPFLKCIPFFSSIKTIASSRVNSLAAVNSFENYVGRERRERERERKAINFRRRRYHRASSFLLIRD